MESKPASKQIATKRRSKKKKSFRGNRFTVSQNDGENPADQDREQTELGENPGGKQTELGENPGGKQTELGENPELQQDEGSTLSSTATISPLSASASKIDLSFYDIGEELDEQTTITTTAASARQKTTDNIDTKCMYMLTDIKIILDLLTLIGKCPECNSDVNASVDFAAKKILINCCDCDWSHNVYLSSMVQIDQHKRYDVNIRSIVAFREIGRGLQHIETFNRIMNTSPPYSQSNYDNMVKDVSGGYLNAMNESMQKAAFNVKCDTKKVLDDNIINVEDTDDHDVINCNVMSVSQSTDRISECDISVDGSWQRRGYASLNGFVSGVERVSDKVVDVEIMTKDCRACKFWNNKQNDPGYNNWKLKHEGSSSSMESEGAVRIFSRSVEKYGLAYINYIGDGDSSAFQKVLESNPYPGKTINKLECIGHIQKRVGGCSDKVGERKSRYKW